MLSALTFKTRDLSTVYLLILKQSIITWIEYLRYNRFKQIQHTQKFITKF